MPYRDAGGNASGWAIMMSEASPSAAARDSPSALMILARFPARPRPGDHGPFHGVARRRGRIIPVESPSFDLRRAGALLRTKKIRALPCSRECNAGAAARVRSDIFILPYFFGFSNLEWTILPRTAVPTGPSIHIGFRPPGNRCSQRLPRSLKMGLRLRFPECIMIRTSSCGTQLIAVGAKPPFA
jgi:hypothetical protein